LDHFSEHAREKTDDVIVERGNPVEQILKQVEEKNCDLIVMGTHGYGTLEDAMIGSTARRVVRRSEKPVLVVQLPEEND
jgi:nucleotide-binding universal stress UspA family protein